jgi:hypothetical protein
VLGVGSVMDGDRACGAAAASEPKHAKIRSALSPTGVR